MKVSVVVGENDEIMACVRTGVIKGPQPGPIEHEVTPDVGQKVYELDVEDTLFEKNAAELNQHLKQLVDKSKDK